MNGEELERRIVALTATLYRVSYGLLRNETDREDAVQAAIEKAWRKASTLRDESRLKPWLVRVLVNECYTLLRRKAREVPVEALPEPEPAPDGNPALHDALLALPEELRLPIVLHYMEGFSVAEVAAALRCPRGTVLSRMSRARARLKTLLTEEDDHDKV